MIGVTFPGEKRVELMNFPDPTPGPGEVVLEMKASGICGSDLHIYRSPSDPKAYREAMAGLPMVSMRDKGPMIMGHEPAGEVVAIGPGVLPMEARIGQRVMVHHYWGCAVCEHCRTGWAQMCETVDPEVYGINAHGGHALYLKVPARTLVEIPEGLSWEAGAAIACGSGTSYSALRRMKVGGGTVAIFGQGPVGLSGTQFAAAMGARVIALDISNDRLARAKQFGADVTINPEEVDAPKLIRELTRGRGADFALESSGSPKAQQDALHCLKIFGSIAFVGFGGPVQLKIGVDMIRRQVTAYGSLTFSTVIQRECAEFAVDRNIAVDAIFTNRWRLDQADEAYRAIDAQASGKGVFLL